MGGKDAEQVVNHCNVYVDIHQQGSNSDVIYVVLSFLSSPFLVPGFQYCVHKSLEGRGGIAHPKEHYFRLKEPPACFECAFPLIGFTDPDVVIPPTHVEFTEYLHSLQIFDTLCKVWEWGDVVKVGWP